MHRAELRAGRGRRPRELERQRGHGYEDEADEGQPSLFSWAEFMAEEPVKPRRRRKAQAPALSLFEWALEQERAPVGAGR